MNINSNWIGIHCDDENLEPDGNRWWKGVPTDGTNPQTE